MIPTNELTVEDLDVNGCVRLMLHVLKERVADKDVEWLESDQCLTTLSYIPETYLPKISHEYGFYTLHTAVDILDLQRTLVSRAKQGKGLARVKKRELSNKRWLVTEPDGTRVIISNIKQYALKRGLRPQGLTNVVYDRKRNSYKGYKIRRL